MLRSLSSFLGDRGRQQHSGDGNDIRYFVEQWFRQQLKSERVRCERVEGGIIVMRASSPAYAQAVYLLGHDLGEALQQEFSDFRFREVKVTQQW